MSGGGHPIGSRRYKSLPETPRTTNTFTRASACPRRRQARIPAEPHPAIALAPACGICGQLQDSARLPCEPFLPAAGIPCAWQLGPCPRQEIPCARQLGPCPRQEIPAPASSVPARGRKFPAPASSVPARGRKSLRPPARSCPRQEIPAPGSSILCPRTDRSVPPQKFSCPSTERSMPRQQRSRPSQGQAVAAPASPGCLRRNAGSPCRIEPATRAGR